MRFFFVRTVKLGRILGIKIEIDFSWFVVFGLVFYSLAFGFFPQLYGYGRGLSIALGLLTTLLFFTSVLLHELSHSVVANRLGLRITKIVLFIFGGVANLSSEPKKPSVELRVAIAGPLMSLLLSAIFFGLSYLLFPVSQSVAVALEYLSFINVALAIFNLIPGYPLDGGRVLRALLWKRLGIVRATTIAARAGMVLGVLLMLYGAWQFLALGNSFALLWFGFIGYFVISAARESELQTRLLAEIGRVYVRDLMSTAVPVVEASRPLRAFVETVMLGQKELGALVRQGGAIVGELTLDHIRRLRVEHLANKTVGDVMQRYTREQYLKPSQPASRALRVLSANTIERIPVLENGRLIGAISRDDVRVFFAVRSDLLNREHRPYRHVEH